MTLWMLDTNTVSYYVKRRLTHAPSRQQLLAGDFCLSAVSEAELLFGLQKRPDAVTLNALIRTLLQGFPALPFDSRAAQRYGILGSEMQRIGKALESLDMLIAAHALSLGATLVTSDQAFRHVPDLTIEDWS